MATFVRDDALVLPAAAAGNVPIEASGAYVGVFTQAKNRVAKTGAKGIELSFQAVDGSTARFLTLWVERANGERMAYGFGLLSALMVCLDLGSIASESIVSDEWDASLGTKMPTKIEVYPALVDRQVGLVLQREEQQWEGKVRVNMRIVDFFDPASRRTAAEVLAGKGETGQLERVLAGLRDRIVKAPPSGPERPAPVGERVGLVDLADDDIPF